MCIRDSFHSKLLSIQKLMPENEAPIMYQTLKKAYDDRLNGASGMFSFKKIDGSTARFLIQFYFLNEDGEQRRFYGSARDVTEITNLHRHMELLSRFTSRTVLFLLYQQGEYSFEVMAHGMEKDMGISRQQLDEELNAGVFGQRLVPASDALLWGIAQKCAETKEFSTTEFVMKGAGGKLLTMVADADYVDDELGDVKCMLSMRRK